MAQSAAEIGDKLFNSGVDGAGSAVGKFLEEGIAKAIEAGELVLDAALTDIARAARIADMKSMCEHKVFSALAAEYGLRAQAAIQNGNARLAEVMSRTGYEFSTAAAAAELRLVQAAAAATSGSATNALAAATALLGDAVAKSIGAIPGLAVSIYKIDQVIANAEQNGASSGDVAAELIKEVINAGTTTAAGFAKGAVDFVAAGKTVKALVGRAGVAGFLLSAAFEGGSLFGEYLNKFDWVQDVAAKVGEPFFKIIYDLTNSDDTIAVSHTDGTVSQLTSNPDNTYVTGTVAPDGSTATTTYNADGIKTAATWQKPDGTFGADTFNANGSITRYANDGQGNDVTINYAPDGSKTGDTWHKADGSSGNDLFYGDGSSTGSVTNPDGSSSSYTNDGAGNSLVRVFDSSGFEVGQVWHKDDGTYGSDTFNNDGTKSGVAFEADGTSTRYTDDGNGNTLTGIFDANNKLTGDYWQHADGTYGYNNYHSDGSKTGTIINPNGTYSSYTDDGHGNTSISTYTPSGRRTSTSWHGEDGSYGNEQVKYDGSVVGTFVKADGSYQQYSDDRKGNVVINNFDSNNKPTGGSWWKDDGSHGSEVIGSDNSRYGTVFDTDGGYTNYSSDGNGNETNTVYNAKGEFVSSNWSYSDGSFGSISIVNDKDSREDGATVYYSNNGNGGETTTVYYPNGVVKTSVKDMPGTGVLDDGEGLRIETQYGPNGEIISNKTINYNPDGSGTITITDADGRETVTNYGPGELGPLVKPDAPDDEPTIPMTPDPTDEIPAVDENPADDIPPDWDDPSDLDDDDIPDYIEETEEEFEEAQQIVSPIVLDLNGDGIATTGLNSGTYFDHDGNGFAENTGWVNGDDGILVLDRNGNGTIDNGSELFGTETLLSNGKKATNGYEALKNIDSNSDGKIDQQDAGYATLRVWKDINGDGYSSADELISLADAGVQSIATSYTAVKQTDANGNITKQTSTFTRTDGSVGNSADIWFTVNKTNSFATDWLPETAAIAALPDLQGFGNVRNLHQAILRDNTGHLQDLVQQFANATNPAARKALINQLIYAWVGVENVAPDSRGYIADARQLYVLEAFMGEGYTQGFGTNAGTPNTGPNAGKHLTSVYNELAVGLYSQLMAQTHYKPLFDSVVATWNATTNQFDFDVSGTVALLQSYYTADVISNYTILAEFSNALKLSGDNGQKVLYAIRSQGDVTGNGFAGWLGRFGFGDYLFGTGGNDSLIGSDIDQAIYGGGGYDSLEGREGSDLLDGGAGNDYLQGGTGNDIYQFNLGSGQDEIFDKDTANNIDTVRFGAGIAPGNITLLRRDYDIVVLINGTSDQLTLLNWGGGNEYRVERLVFADGTVWDAAQILAHLADAQPSGTEGDDVLFSWAGENVLFQGLGGNDILYGFTGKDTLDGGAGVDTLIGGQGNDTLDGGAGNDYLQGGTGNDVYLFNLGSGQDEIFDTDTSAGNVDTVRFGAGIAPDSIVLSRHGYDIVATINGTSDKLTLLNWGGGNRVERFEFADGSVWAASDMLSHLEPEGTAGDDVIYAWTGEDSHLQGLGGNDTLHGNAGHDTLNGGAGVDTLLGGQGNDTLDGGAGNDYLQGDTGNDVYLFNLGSGQDEILDTDTTAGNVDTVRFGAGIAPDNIVLTRRGYDIVVTINGTSDKLTLRNWGLGNRVERFEFANGSVWAASDMLSHLEPDGTAGDDVIYAWTDEDYHLQGLGGNDTLHGSTGNDTLDGGAGVDTLIGGQGYDTYVIDNVGDVVKEDLGEGIDLVQSSVAYELASNVENLTLTGADAINGTGNSLNNVLTGNAATNIMDGGSGNDTLDGGSGADTLIGGTGNDSYVVDDAGDVVTENSTISTEIDWVQSSADYTLSDNVENLTLTGIAALNGTGNTMNNTLTGNSANNTLIGGAGNDMLDGGGYLRGWGYDGTDTLIGGAGDDTYYVTPATGDVVVELANEGNDTVIANFGYTLADNVENLIIRSNSLYPVTATGNALDNVITGQINTVAYIDQYGRFIGDTIDGGAGADIMTIAHGGTFYVDNVGDQIWAAGLINVFSSIDYVLPEFAGGVYPAVSDLTLLAGAGDIDGTGNGGNNTITDNSGDNVLSGGAGNDKLIAVGGSDTLIGGLGNDTYSIRGGDGGGKDVINNTASDGAAAIDTLEVSGSAILLRDGDDLIVSTGPNASATVKNHFAADGLSRIDRLKFLSSSMVWDAAQIEQNLYVQPQGTSITDTLAGTWNSDTIHGLGGDDTISGDESADTLYGDAGNDTLNGDSGNDVLVGGVGNDTLVGGMGNDSYVYNLGDGADEIGDTGWFESTDATGQPQYVDQPNALDFGAGITADSITPVWDGKTLKLDLGNGDSIFIGAWKLYDANNVYFDIAVQDLKFIDGSVLSVQDFLAERGLQSIGDATVQIGTRDDDELIGGIGADILSGESGNDTLIGDAGNDVLFGRAGDDTLNGGAGNDLMQGGSGDDMYLFGFGSGQDEMVDGDGYDTIQFASGIDQSDLLYKKVNADLQISIANSADTITVQGWFAGNSSVNTLQFANNWDSVDLPSMGMDLAAQTIVGASTGEEMIGSIYNDSLQGGGGDDVLIGGVGNDTYVFNSGDGRDEIYELTGNDTIVFGAGITPGMLRLNMQVVSSEWAGTQTAFPDPSADLTAFERQRQPLSIQIGDQGDEIAVMSGKGAIENYVFADGSTYTWQQLAAMQGVISVTDSNDQPNQPILDWDPVNGYTYGAWTSPHRTLDGSGCAADFNGGIGNDTMIGGLYGDVYRFNLGDGQDVIADFGGINEIAFGADVSVSDVYWSYDPADITPFVLNVGSNGDSIAVLDGENGSIQRFSFADGTVLTFDQLIAAQGGIDLVARSLDDQSISMPSSWESNNLIVGGDGADTINVVDLDTNSNLIVSGKGDDTIDFNHYNRSGDTLVFNLGDGQDTVVIGDGSEAAISILFGVGISPDSVIVEVVDGVEWDWHVQNMRIRYGNQGDEIFVEGSIARPGEGGGDVPNIAHVKFVDGTVLGFGDLMDMAKAQSSIAENSGQRIQANPINSVLIGGSGNDTYVIGNQPAEYLVMDSGANAVELGWTLPSLQGDNSIADQTTQQDAHWSYQTQAVVDVASYRLTYEGGALVVGFSNDVTLRIDGFDPQDPLNSISIQQFNFADGTTLSLEQLLAQGFDISDSAVGVDTIDGTALNDRIQGMGEDDTIAGGAGNDVLAGGAGNDTYLYNSGDGADVIVDQASHWDGQQYVLDNNVLQLGAGIDAASVAVKLDPNNGQVYLDFGNGDSINIGAADDLAVQSVQFDDGTVWDGQALASSLSIEANPNAVPGTALLLVAGAPITYTATLADGSDLPSWLTYDSASQTFSGIPSNWDVGSIDLMVNATDGYGNSLARSFVLNVQNVNDAPIVEQALTDSSVPENTPFNYVVPADTFDDIDIVYGDSLTYSATQADGSALPSWLTFDVATQTFSGTPTKADRGVLSVSVVATDTGGLSASAVFELDVFRPNTAPIAVSDLVTMTEDDGVSTIAIADLLANDIDSDSDDTLSLAGADIFTAEGNIVSQDGNGNLILGVRNNYQSWGAGQTVVDSFTYTVSDITGATSTATVNVTIAGTDDAPVMATALADQSILEDAAYTFTVPIGTFIDIDYGDTLTYTATLADGSALPSWLVFDAATQTFSGTPGNGEVGSYAVTVTATDAGGLGASSSFSINVANINDLPVVSMAMADQSTLEDAAFSYTIPAGSFTDVDFIHGDSLSYAVTMADGSALPSWLSFDAATQTFSGTPTNSDVGALNVRVTAADLAGASVAVTFALDVVNVNDAPVVVADTAAVQEDLGITATGNVLANDSDVDQGTVLQVANTGVFAGQYGQLTLNADGSYTYVLDSASLNVQSLAAGQVVTETFAYQATDGIAFTPATLTVNITGTNTTPVVVADTATAQEDLGIAATGNVLANDSDVDQGTVLQVANAGVFAGQYGQLTLNADGSYSYALDNASPAVQSLTQGQTVTETFAYQATDGIVTIPSSLTVSITGTNDAPVVATAIAAQITEEDAAFSYTIPTGTFSDVDQGDVLSYSATLADGTALPGWLVFDAATQTFSGTPGNGEVGSYAVTVTAADAVGLAASSSFNIDVVNVNDVPVVSVAMVDQSALEDVLFSFTIPAGTFTDADFIHGDSLSYAVTMADGSALPSWLVFDSATQTFSGTPGNGDVGTLNVRITAADQAGASVSATFALDVLNVNDAPVASDDAVTASNTATVISVASLLANDYDIDVGDSISLTGFDAITANGNTVMQDAAGNLVFDPSTSSGQATGNRYQYLGTGQSTTDSFTYTITDTAGATSTATVNVIITGANDAPVVVADTAVVQEDYGITASGNVLTNDSDIDQGTVLQVLNAGIFTGQYGQLELLADGSYTYQLDNASASVQSLAAGQTISETFAYEATDGMVSTPSALTVSIIGTNDAPAVVADTASVREDLDITAIGNVLANDSDVDQGSVLSVADAGTKQGLYGSLTLGTDGSYNYALDSASQAVQSLGRNAQVTEHFGYTVTDGIAGTASGLDILIAGSNDAPVLTAALADQNAVANQAFSWQMPTGSFTDIDTGDTLAYTATQADGTALPSWLTFDATTRTFSGQAPQTAGFVDVMVTASDVAADGSTQGSLAASDTFRITVAQGNSGGGNGGNCGDGHHGQHGGGHGGSHGGAHDDHGHHSDRDRDHERDDDRKHCKDDSHRDDKHDDHIDELIHSWFEKGNRADQHELCDGLGRGDNRIDHQANRNVAHGISNDYSKQWAQMNAKLKEHMAQNGNDDHFDTGASHGAPALFGSSGAHGLSQLGKTEGVQMKSFAGLKEGLERIGC